MIVKTVLYLTGAFVSIIGAYYMFYIPFSVGGAWLLQVAYYKCSLHVLYSISVECMATISCLLRVHVVTCFIFGRQLPITGVVKFIHEMESWKLIWRA